MSVKLMYPSGDDAEIDLPSSRARVEEAIEGTSQVFLLLDNEVMIAVADRHERELQFNYEATVLCEKADALENKDFIRGRCMVMPRKDAQRLGYPV